jgi:hypothetical protein
VRSNVALAVGDEHASPDKLTIYLIDDLGSLAGDPWRQTADALTAITPICTAHDDADGIDIYYDNQSAERSIGKESSASSEIFNSVRPHGGVPTDRYFEKAVKKYHKEAWPDVDCPVNFVHITDGFPDHDDYDVSTNLAKELDHLDGTQWQVGLSSRRSYGLYNGACWRDRWNLEWQVLQGYHRHKSWKPSRTVALLGIASCLPMVTAHKIMSESSPASATDVVGDSVLNVDPVQDHLSDFYRWVTTWLPPTFLVFGLSVSAWVLLRKKKETKGQATTAQKHSFWWLMAFMASVTCWVFFATTDGPSDGKAVAFSAWVAFFAIYQSLNFRTFSHHKIYLFTSLVGGTVAASIIAGAMIAPAQGNRSNAVVEQALIVSPTVLTAWSWLVATLLRTLENKKMPNVPDEEHEAIELNDR